MKKLLLVLAIGATFAACNNSAGDKPAGTDTTVVVPADTAKPVVVDTMKHDTTKVDTTKK